MLHLAIRNTNDPTDEDTYAMALKENRAGLAFDGLPPGVVVQPYVFERAPRGAAVATDWEPNRAYVAGDSDVPNPQMKAIFDEDQRVRSTDPTGRSVAGGTDAERRAQTSKLLAAGALHTGKDFEEAAFVFQHGDSPPDYLLAHALAMVAVSKGDATAIWIAAATLDHYLHRIGQKQILGTQFVVDPKSKWTQEPYDRELISDSLRQQLGVPPQSVRAEQLRAYRMGLRLTNRPVQAPWRAGFSRRGDLSPPARVLRNPPLVEQSSPARGLLSIEPTARPSRECLDSHARPARSSKP